jgi:hypothetical protein
MNASQFSEKIHVSQTDDRFTIENDKIRRTFRWNQGDLISREIEDKTTGVCWKFAATKPDFSLPDFVPEKVSGQWYTESISETPIAPAHLQVIVLTEFQRIWVKRVFRIYENCPAIACDLYLRGNSADSWESLLQTGNSPHKPPSPVPVFEQLEIQVSHLKLKCVQFFDITDRRNNLVTTRELLPYRSETTLSGNLLFINDLLTSASLFILKEAPCSDVQLAYPGFDFSCKQGEIKLAGLGISPADLKPERWTRGYGFVTGVARADEFSQLTALRTYQEKKRRRKSGRDFMLLLNTWGDRSQDRRIGEEFALKELEAAKRLGLSHFQLDDGWENGHSANSATAGGSLEKIWRTEDYWTVHPARFPNGLKPVKQRADELGIDLGLWFNPSKDSSYANWERDAAVILKYYKELGIRTFKIDGLDVIDKTGEENVRRMFETILAASNHEIVFNLDITAGHRFGYHYFNEYGNLFLENRYTDWVNYYPHWTLRNLWLLARYLPTQNLQIEFLNKWRNPDKYPANDPLAPIHVPFEYCFAVTMMAQPLAWFEASQLPDAAFAAAPLISKYRKYQETIHSGQILPIGEEPLGISWTGFQSILSANHGFVLAFRENNDRPQAQLKLWGTGQPVSFKKILGEGTDFAASGSLVNFQLSHKFSFGLFEYFAATD